MIDTTTRVQLVNVNKTTLESTEVTNGCVYFVEDTKELFYDLGSKRTEVKDILILEKEAERTSILFSPLNKFYFVIETQILWLYKDGNWYRVTADFSDYYNKTEIGEILDGKADVSVIPEINLATSTLAGIVKPDNTSITVSEDGTICASVPDLTDQLNQKADKENTYTKEEVNAKLSAVYRYKGTIETIDALPETAEQGDVYNVEDTGANYAWDGINWDKLSETIDLTPYLTKQEATETYATIDSISGKQNIITETDTIKIKETGLDAVGVIEKNSGNAIYDWIGTVEQWQEGRANGTILDSYLCFVTND